MSEIRSGMSLDELLNRMEQQNMQSEIRRLKTALSAAAEALAEAAESMEEWAEHVDGYVRAKHDLTGAICNIKRQAKAAREAG